MVNPPPEIGSHTDGQPSGVAREVQTKVDHDGEQSVGPDQVPVGQPAAQLTSVGAGKPREGDFIAPISRAIASPEPALISEGCPLNQRTLGGADPGAATGSQSHRWR